MPILPDLEGLKNDNYSHPTPAALELACVYDFDGLILEIDAALASLTGSSREQPSGAHVRDLFHLEPHTPGWQLVPGREDIFPQPARLADLRARDGSPVRAAVSVDRLWERDRAVALRCTARPLDPSAVPPAPPSISAAHLAAIHNLSAAFDGGPAADSIADRVLIPHLRLGRELLGLPLAMIIEIDDDAAAARCAAWDGLPAPAEFPLSRTPWASAPDRLRTCVSPASLRDTRLRPEFAAGISTPIWEADELRGLLCFCGPDSARRPFSAADCEAVRALARALSGFARAGQCGFVRQASGREEAQDRALDMAARREPPGDILRQLARMLEAGSSPSAGSLYLADNGRLLCVSSPRLGPEYARRFNAAAQLREPARARDACQAEDFDASAWGYTACVFAPVFSAQGRLLGASALHSRRAIEADAHARLGRANRLAALVMEQSRLLGRLEFHRAHDSLTGLLNRSGFLDQLAGALQEAHRRAAGVCVLFIDLDDFQRVNAAHGQELGDRLLAAVAVRICAATGDAAAAGRVGGDEFAVWLPADSAEDGPARTSGELLEALRLPYLVGGRELSVTASIGASLLSNGGAADAHALFGSAETAASRARQSGGNQVRVFAPDSLSLPPRHNLESSLGKALDNREFELRYQPLVGMDGRLEGFEALLSWNHPVRGPVSPKDFIPLAEQTGLIVPIGAWVLREACLQGAAWRKAGHRPTRISVNVSAVQFERANFVETVSAALALSGFPPDCLDLELTESFVMRDADQSARRMSQLRALGVSISIDDFGTGYSSLSYLSSLPADALKIDQSFLRNLHAPSGSLPVVQTIIRLAHNMNLLVVAEGVETVEELNLLRVVGCDKVQGHLFGHSLPQSEAAMLLARQDGLVPPRNTPLIAAAPRSGALR